MVLDWGLNPGPPALEGSTLQLGYRGGGSVVPILHANLKYETYFCVKLNLTALGAVLRTCSYTIGRVWFKDQKNY